MTASDPVQIVLDRLQGVKAAGKGQWQAKCPAHSDDHASLSIARGEKGVVLHCHAGCATEEIVRAMGLTMRDLFAAEADGQHPVKVDTKLNPPAKSPTSSHSAKMASVFRSAEAAFEYVARNEGSTLVAQWRYPHDALRVGRFALPNGKKDYRPVHRVRQGWMLGDPSGLLPLYRSDEIPPAGPIAVCEGEKTCDAAWAVNLPAVTSSHGAILPSKSDWTPLRGREVIILPDCDEAGERYAQKVAAILAELNPPAAVRIVRLPGLEVGGDIVDWTDAGGPMDSKSAEEIRDAIMALAAAAPVWTDNAPADAPTSKTETPTNQEPPAIIRPAFVSVSDLLANFPAQREPIIDGLLRRGEVGNLVSAPKMNKSWLLLHVALCVAFGRNVLSFPTRPGRVLLLDYELAPGTLAKRLQVVMSAMGLTAEAVGDRLAIESLRGRRLDVDGLGQYFSALQPRQFSMIVVDPLYRTFPHRGPLTRSFDENSNSDLADLYATLCSYAERLDAGLLVVHHLTKGDQSAKSVTDLGAGGGSQSRAADAHLAIRPHAEDGAAVLSGVVRSFPPFEPIAMRWRFPVWELAEDLDPTDLKRPPKRTPTPKVTPPPEPVKPSYDVIRFVAEFLTASPKSKAAIIAQANGAGINDHQAGKFLASAEARNLAFRWKQPKDKRTYFANRSQPALTACVGAPTHT